MSFRKQQKCVSQTEGSCQKTDCEKQRTIWLSLRNTMQPQSKKESLRVNQMDKM